MDASLREVSLGSVGGGAAVELFDIELAKALANIGDVNTPATAVREVTLKIKLKPSEQRDFAAVAISVTSKLPGLAPYVANVFLGTDGTTVRAYEHQAKQGDLGLENVKSFRKGTGA